MVICMDKLFRLIYRTAVVLFFFTILIYGLVQARTLLYPLVFAMLFSFLLLPLANYLERKGFTRILTNFIIIFFTAAVVSAVFYLLFSEIELLLADMPVLREHAKENMAAIAESISSKSGFSTVKLKETFNEGLSSLWQYSFLIETVFPSTTATLIAISLLPAYTFFMLYYRDKIYETIMMIVPPEKRSRIIKIVSQISQVTKHYMRGVFFVVLILCFLNTLGLMIVGVRFALLMGIISALCNFIPYFGTLIGFIFPLIMAILTGESPHETAGVLIVFLIVQFIENNILTPNITGASVQINPLVTIISIIAGAMVWGIPGMFVIVPLIGMIKIFLANYRATKPLSYLIGTNGTEKHSITIRKLRAVLSLHRSDKKEI
jgi:predicted PurR-regulated permease PerM